MDNKGLIIGTAAILTAISGYIAIEKKIKHKKPQKEKYSALDIPQVKRIGIVNAEDVGFEDYSHLKYFEIDKKREIRVLITGTGSYIGEYFKAYCKQYYPNIECTAIDMAVESWRNYNFSGYDVVFHVAGIAHADIGKISVEDEEKYYKVNTNLAIECCVKAKTSGVSQFIFMSSMIIYGHQEYIDEHTFPNPANFYGNSKWLADVGVRKLQSDNFRVAVLRPPMIYGKGSKGNYQTLSKIARKVPIFPDIDNKRSVLYIENLCEFVAQLSLTGQGGIYFPQNREYIRTSDMVRLIGNVVHKPVRISKALTPIVSLAGIVPGKIRRLADKAFGNNCYDLTLSTYEGLDYQRISLEESLRRTEG